MAKETETKRGPGRPPGSKNKNTGTKSSTGTSSKSGSRKVNEVRASSRDPEDVKAAIRQERIEQMQAEYDRDRRNVDVIWSITLIAVALFLFFTVVMDSTGSFGMKVHDIALGLFGLIAYLLPFMVLIFAVLLLAGKLRHFSGRTLAFSALIILNVCILNSYRFIDDQNIGIGFADVADYYITGTSLDSGGVLGMEFGSLLVKFFGKPGLLIIAAAVLLISVFLVANSPISRFFDNLSNKHEKRRIMREMDDAETAKVQMAVARTATPGADPETGIVPRQKGAREVDMQYTIVEPADGGKSLWRTILNGISKEEEPAEVPQRNTIIEPLEDIAAGKPSDKELGDYAAARAGKDIIYTQPQRTSAVTAPATIASYAGDTPAGIQNTSRDTWFGRIRKKIAGTDPSIDIPEEVKSSRYPEMNFDEDDTDYGYPGRRKRSSSASTADKKTEPPADEPKSYGFIDETGAETDNGPALSRNKSYGLADTGETSHSGKYGLDGHSTPSAYGRGLEAAVPASGKAAGATGLGLAASGASQTPKTNSRNGRPAAGRNNSSRTAQTSRAPSPAPAADDKDKDDVYSPEDTALAESFDAASEDDSYVLPPVSLLKRGASGKQMMSNYQLEEKANLLEKTLNDFGVDARVLTVTQGASVTRYEVQPATGVKVSSITRLADDIALNLRAKSIRIEAPIPGKAAVGIEVENDKPSPVLIRELIDSEEFEEAESKIEFVVGKDISGNNVVANLKDMPHLLIAGATGSGKSVCINTIITSFLYKARPSELKLIMIDPKVVELANYNGIPHLLTPVVTDARKAARALAIAVEEMDKRYEAFAKEGVKDLESYNELMRANHEFARCKPQVVIIIDELADLMMAAASDVENSICRLAQKARAAGMHLIVATQRPSVDVVTGLIKANIPSRIAFSVASQTDSRTILDMAGAEKLLGKGDMLFSPVGSSKPYRVQGPFISDAETEKVIRFVKKEGGGPTYDEELQNAIENPDKKGGSEPQDELTDDAIAFILKSKQASVSMLQRRFRIGYNRAARIIDEIEDKGIIGPSDGSRPRQVLVTEDEYYARGTGAMSEAASQGDGFGVSGGRFVPPADEDREEPVSIYNTAGRPHMNIVSSTPAAEEVPAEEVYTEDEPDTDDAGSAVDYFNSLPESVRRQILDSDRRYNE